MAVWAESDTGDVVLLNQSAQFDSAIVNRTFASDYSCSVVNHVGIGSAHT